jgi:predicted SAM-dependent methyltransferase
MQFGTQKKLNLGGGMHWSQEGWLNLDKAQNGYELRTQSLKEWADNSVDLMYSSHCIEHVEWEYVNPYLKMIYRVLKPGGVIRFVIPDIDIMWEILRTNDKARMNLNDNYYVGPKATRPVMVDIRELFGWDASNTKFLENTMHRSFFNESILGIMVTNTGFSKIERKKEPNDSEIPDFRDNPARYNGEQKPRLFLGGFDNVDHHNISSYFEVTK